jgi:hypothetical protein
MIVGLLPLGLAGCPTVEEQLAKDREHFAKFDDGKCQSYGAKPGTPAYVQCRAQLDAARSQSPRNNGGCTTTRTGLRSAAASGDTGSEVRISRI